MRLVHDGWFDIEGSVMNKTLIVEKSKEESLGVNTYVLGFEPIEIDSVVMDSVRVFCYYKDGKEIKKDREYCSWGEHGEIKVSIPSDLKSKIVKLIDQVAIR